MAEWVPAGACPRAGRRPDPGAGMTRRRTALFGSLDAGSFPLRPQFQKSAPVVLRRDLYKGRDRVVPVFEEGARPRATGEQVMALEQDAQPRGIETQRVTHAVVVDARRALPRPLAGVVLILGQGDGFELDLAVVAKARRAALRVPDIGDAARHAGGEIAAGITDHDDDPAGHIFAAMVAGAFDDGDGTRIAHGEAFAGYALEIRFTGDCAVEHGVADDDVLGRLAPRLGRLAHDQPAAR